MKGLNCFDPSGEYIKDKVGIMQWLDQTRQVYRELRGPSQSIRTVLLQ